MSELAERLRALRGTLTQREVGELLAVSAALVSSWESGAAVPPRHRLQSYADELGNGNGLLEELLLLRADANGAKTVPSPGISDLLVEIRSLLLDISRRLPPHRDVPRPHPHSWDEQPEND